MKMQRHRVCFHRFLICIAAFINLAVGMQAQTIRPGIKTLRSTTIISQPNATVWLDGVKYGKTAENGRIVIQTEDLKRRVVRIRAEGFAPASKVLAAGHEGDILVPLIKTADQAELTYQQAEAFSTSDRERAVEAYKKAIRLRPNFVDAQLGLARIYSEGGSRDEAASVIKALRRINPRISEASVIEGRIFKSEGDDDKAIVSFNRALKESGGFQPEAFTGLGLIYKQRAESFGASGQYDEEDSSYSEAARYFAAAIKQLSGAPDAVVLYQLLGLVYEQQKKFNEAIGVYQEFLRRFPEHNEAAAFDSFIVQLKKQLNEPE